MKLMHGDCIEKMQDIESGSIDLILTDPPYGNMYGGPTGWGCEFKWDVTLEPLKIYEMANRVLRKNGKMVLFSQEPYTTKLIVEAVPNLPLNYRAIWEKDNFANALLVNKAMAGFFEDILIFSKNYDLEMLHPLREYFKKTFDYIGHSKKTLIEQVGQRVDHVFRFNSPQFDLCTEETYQLLIYNYCIDSMEGFLTFAELTEADASFRESYPSTFNLWEGGKYKGNILKYKKDYTRLHPTQKPVLLLEDLIKTYTNEGDTVLDFTMGSGSTGVACLNTDRDFIGIEKDDNYFQVAKNRIEQHLLKMAGI